MTDTPNLNLPCIEDSQAQKHITHNDALRILDSLVQLAVLTRTLSAPPGAPSDGQRWIVKPTATGAWAGHDNAVAAWQDGAWIFSTPQTGWLAYIVDESALLAWSGSAWIDAIAALTSLNNLTLLGVGTTADTTNPLSAKLNNTLFTAKTVAEGGDGNLRYKLSKEAAANTLSFLFQDNFSGRAEIGLTGDDDFHFKVSADGTTWNEGIVISKATGAVTLPNTSSSIIAPGGRLTLATGTPVLTADTTAQQTVYYTPYCGATVPIYNGAGWSMQGFGELSVDMAGNSNWASGSVYDWFIINDAGTLRLASGPAWSSTTSRGSGAGSSELQQLNGIWTNKNAITARYGASNTVSVGANQATYVGTMYCTANGQTGMAFLPAAAAGGSNPILGLWNAYHREPVNSISRDATDSWTYATATWRPANGSNANRVSFVVGLPVAHFVAQYSGYLNNASSSVNAFIGIGFDSATTPTSGQTFGDGFGAVFAQCFALLCAPLNGIGLHYVQAMEMNNAGGTTTFYGDAGVADRLQAAISLRLEM